MNILIFKTNIRSKSKIDRLKPVFNQHPAILKWGVDTQDIDNVLRIEARQGIKEAEVVEMVNEYGFHCEDLPD